MFYGKKMKMLVVILIALMVFMFATSGEDHTVVGTCALGLIMFISLSWIFKAG